METMMTGKKIGKCGFYISRQHRRTSSLGHDNKQNNFFSCFPFSSFMLLWLLLLKLLLDRQLWRKGGIAATCPSDAAAFCSSWFFFQPEKRQKSCSTHEFEANLQMALLSLLEEHFHFFLAMETFGLFWVLHFLSPTKFKIFLFPHLFLTDAFLLHVMRRETRCDIFFEDRAVATVTLASRAALPRRHKFLSRAIDWGVKVTFEWAKVNYVACCASFFHCCRSGNCSLTCQILAD